MQKSVVLILISAPRNSHILPTSLICSPNCRFFNATECYLCEQANLGINLLLSSSNFRIGVRHIRYLQLCSYLPYSTYSKRHSRRSLWNLLASLALVFCRSRYAGFGWRSLDTCYRDRRKIQSQQDPFLISSAWEHRCLYLNGAFSSHFQSLANMRAGKDLAQLHRRLAQQQRNPCRCRSVQLERNPCQ